MTFKLLLGSRLTEWRTPYFCLWLISRLKFKRKPIGQWYLSTKLLNASNQSYNMLYNRVKRFVCLCFQ